MITLKDISIHSGVSLRVVAEVMKAGGSDGKGNIRFSRATREKVLGTARDLNYRPNRAARSLRGRRQNAIGLYVGQSIFSVSDLVLNQLLKLCREKGLVPIIELAPIKAGELPVSMQEHSVDALIVFDESPILVDALAKIHLPVLYVNSNRTRGPGVIVYDEMQGMQLAVNRLTQAGRRNLAYICLLPDSGHYSWQGRVDAFCATSGDCVHKIEASVSTVQGRKSCIQHMVKMLRASNKPDGVILQSSMFTPFLYQAAAECGLVIPDDLSVLGFGHSGLNYMIQPELSSIEVNSDRLAISAFDNVMKMMEGDVIDEPIRFPFELVERNSV